MEVGLLADKRLDEGVLNGELATIAHPSGDHLAAAVDGPLGRDRDGQRPRPRPPLLDGQEKIDSLVFWPDASGEHRPILSCT
jgi:hypothetical protein